MRVTDSERAFLHELHMVRKDPLGKRLIHFFVSLAPHSPDLEKRLEWTHQFIKKNFANSPYCEVFQASNNDIFVTYSHVTVSTVLAACARIEKVFMSDGVVSVRNAYNEYAFYKVCDAVKDLDKVFTAFKTLIALNQPSPEKFTKRPMAPAALVMLAEKLRTSDLRNCIFNQPVYFIGDKVPSIEYLEFYVSSQMIEQTFIPDNSVTANPWLFNALKEHFDRAIFKVVAREIPEYRHKSFAINVSLPMVLSREFTDFCSTLPTRLAGRIVIEIHKTDVVQNLGLYRDVESLAAEKELRLCIEGVEWGDFDVLNFSRVKADFIKVIWHNDMLAADAATMGSFVKAIKSHEGAEVILSRCDHPRAFPLAKALGIRYVQGKLADQFFKGRMEI
jgi:EAL domain